MNTERKEAFMRLLVLLVTGLILGLWRGLIQIITVVHFFIVLFDGKRNVDLAEFSEIWNTQVYVFIRYINFVSNERPFPFMPLKKNMSKFGK